MLDINVLIINLESRPDRKDEVLLEVEKLQCKSVEIVSAITHEDPNVSCTLSHQKCIQIAKERGWECVLILEDDVVFDSDVNDVLEKTIENICKFDWNLLYLGCNIKYDSKKVASNLIRVSEANMTHAYIIHNSFYDVVLGQPADLVIDYLYRRLSKKHLMYACSPMIAFQRPSFSDIRREHVNYKSDMLKNYKKYVI